MNKSLKDIQKSFENNSKNVNSLKMTIFDLNQKTNNMNNKSINLILAKESSNIKEHNENKENKMDLMNNLLIWISDVDNKSKNNKLKDSGNNLGIHYIDGFFVCSEDSYEK